MAEEAEENQNHIRSEVERIFMLFADDIYRYAHYTLRNQEDAQDVVQDVFLKAYRNWSTLRTAGGERQWLYRIARNTLIDRMRRKKIQRLYRNMSQQTTPSAGLNSLIELQDALDRLKPFQRQVFILRCVQDMSVTDTARILTCSEGRVKTTLHRAIRALQNTLSVDTVEGGHEAEQSDSLDGLRHVPRSEFEGGFRK